MTRKKARINRGKEIRRATGIKLPVAMNLAKRERRGTPEESDFPGIVVVSRELEQYFRDVEDPDVQVRTRVEYVGPRGRMVVKETLV